jgi:F0F1-type ATP synthase assembly protein I
MFWGLGWLFDAWLGTEPWGQVVGGVLGWVGGTLHVYYKSQSGGIWTR